MNSYIYLDSKGLKFQSQKLEQHKQQCSMAVCQDGKFVSESIRRDI